MAASYNHVQAGATTVWLINHNLASPVVVLDVYVDNLGNLEKILPSEVKYIDDDTTQVTFTTAQTGNARVAV